MAGINPNPKHNTVSTSTPMGVKISWDHRNGIEWCPKQCRGTVARFWLCVGISLCCAVLSFFNRYDPVTVFADLVSFSVAGSVFLSYVISVVGAIYYHRRIVWMAGYCIGAKHGVMLRNSGGIRRFDSV